MYIAYDGRIVIPQKKSYCSALNIITLQLSKLLPACGYHFHIEVVQINPCIFNSPPHTGWHMSLNHWCGWNAAQNGISGLWDDDYKNCFFQEMKPLL